MEKTSKYYKDLTIKEFTEAAERYEGKNSGIYEMCKYDYPQILEEIEKETFSDLLNVCASLSGSSELLQFRLQSASPGRKIYSAGLQLRQ